jgi:hypothetical protein
MTAAIPRGQFDPARARETARRLREGQPAAPLFTRDIKEPGKDGVIVISSIGRPKQTGAAQ